MNNFELTNIEITRQAWKYIHTYFL